MCSYLSISTRNDEIDVNVWQRDGETVRRQCKCVHCLTGSQAKCWPNWQLPNRLEIWKGHTTHYANRQSQVRWRNSQCHLTLNQSDTTIITPSRGQECSHKYLFIIKGCHVLDILSPPMKFVLVTVTFIFIVALSWRITSSNLALGPTDSTKTFSTEVHRT